DYVREHNEAVNALDFMPERAPIIADFQPGEVQVVTLHDGSLIRLRKIGADYNVHDRIGALAHLMRRDEAGEIVTGLIYLENNPSDLHENLDLVDTPLNRLPDTELSPGSSAL